MVAARDRFRGRSALVTGAGGDIGSAVAARLAAEGAKVTLVDRDRDALDGVAAAITRGGGDVRPYPADVAVEDEVAQAVAAAVTFGGGLDCVFNNAGVTGPVAPVTELDLAAVARVLQVNVLGALAVAKHTLPHLKAGGVLVQTGSTASVAGAPHLAPYVMSKHALLGLTRAAAKEVAGRGVRVCAISPGPVQGRMMAGIDGGRERAGTEPPPNPLALDGGRYARVGEVVDAVLFLLSDDASFVSGSALVVDGGRLA
ncbi:SDR family NAD(P)-dependent oxidoreductase [Georgenia thermotolerans]|uniref:SDR family oxidoreductase n=1 Tax=Georgenia thermotolerans TaxID=527326 RepID=A0A7J5UUD0_9MICO|nr:SDR family oxidoreductase [Georgenia thermotolerans]KAE8765882.1 SDR family oxidoreductase [Georgenia thermotolerans]